MSEFESLELELATLRPREPSVELKARIASRLAEPSLSRPRQPSSMWQGGALVAGLLAASVAAVLVWHGDDGRAPSASKTSVGIDIAVDFDESLPSLWSYRAATRPPSKSLNELLDKYAEQTLVPKAGGASAFVFERSGITIDSWLGEL